MEEFGKKKKKVKKKNINFIDDDYAYQDASNDHLYAYDELLKLVSDNLSSEDKGKLTLVMPNIIYRHKKTIITNFSKICWNITAQPDHLIKFFIKDLAFSNLTLKDEKELIISKRISEGEIKNILKSYMKRFKRCSTCGRYETKIEKEKRIHYISCLSCNAKQSCPSM